MEENCLLNPREESQLRRDLHSEVNPRMAEMTVAEELKVINAIDPSF